MRILGIDPGSRVTGFGIVEGSRSRCQAIAKGTIRLGDGPLPGRLLALHRALGDLLLEHRPGAVAVEGIFSQRAQRSALILGHARGVALLCAAQAELPVYEYPPATVKRSLTSGGAASKDTVARAVSMLLGLRDPMPVDASDALAVALCHLSRQGGPTAARGREPNAWLRAITAAPTQRQTPQNALLAAALRHR